MNKLTTCSNTCSELSVSFCANKDKIITGDDFVWVLELIAKDSGTICSLGISLFKMNKCNRLIMISKSPH